MTPSSAKKISSKRSPPVAPYVDERFFSKRKACPLREI
jgi:hypothetical protein